MPPDPLVRCGHRTQDSESRHLATARCMKLWPLNQTCCLRNLTSWPNSLNCNIFRLTHTVALFTNKARFFSVTLLFGACSLQNEVGDPPFVGIFGKSRSLPFCMASLKKICVWEHFWRERPKLTYLHDYQLKKDYQLRKYRCTIKITLPSIAVDTNAGNPAEEF